MLITIGVVPSDTSQVGAVVQPAGAVCIEQVSRVTVMGLSMVIFPELTPGIAIKPPHRIRGASLIAVLPMTGAVSVLFVSVCVPVVVTVIGDIVVPQLKESVLCV